MFTAMNDYVLVGEIIDSRTKLEIALMDSPPIDENDCLEGKVQYVSATAHAKCGIQPGDKVFFSGVLSTKLKDYPLYAIKYQQIYAKEQ